MKQPHTNDTIDSTKSSIAFLSALHRNGNTPRSTHRNMQAAGGYCGATFDFTAPNTSL